MPADSSATVFDSYAAVGDSFSEGVGDELPDGTVRGWADLVALGLAASAGRPVGYANLAIRGRLMRPIVTQQLDDAIALRPALLSINGGGNDIMRPRVSIEGVADQLLAAVQRATDAGIHVLLVSGANPTGHLPAGRFMQRRGDRLAAAVRDRLPDAGVTWVDNWSDEQLAQQRYWSIDGLHLGPAGHRRVAANVLEALAVPVPADDAEVIEPTRPGTAEYWRSYVLPWIGRRLTGRSSGDARMPKSPTLRPVDAGG